MDTGHQLVGKKTEGYLNFLDLSLVGDFVHFYHGESSLNHHLKIFF